jgi:hypothetical protein
MLKHRVYGTAGEDVTFAGKDAYIVDAAIAPHAYLQDPIFDAIVSQMKKIFPKTKFDRETDFKLLLDQKFHDTASASNSNLPRDKLIRIFKSLNHENAQSLLETAEELLHSQLTDGQDSDGEETENHDN